MTDARLTELIVRHRKAQSDLAAIVKRANEQHGQIARTCTETMVLQRRLVASLRRLLSTLVTCRDADQRVAQRNPGSSGDPLDRRSRESGGSRGTSLNGSTTPVDVRQGRARNGRPALHDVVGTPPEESALAPRRRPPVGAR